MTDNTQAANAAHGITRFARMIRLLVKVGSTRAIQDVRHLGYYCQLEQAIKLWA
jgi:hypothetical protein